MVRVHPDPPPTSSDGRIHQVRAGLPPATQQDGAFERLSPRRPEDLKRGAVAQLGEHLLCKQGVTGSIPVSSTRFPLPCSIVIPPVRTYIRMCAPAVSLWRCKFTVVFFNNQESCWRLGLHPALQPAATPKYVSHLRRNQQDESCCACDLRLFEVIWSSEQAHTVDA